MRPFFFIKTFSALACCLICLAGLGHAVEVSIAQAEAKSGETISVPIMIDAVDNLAGVKLVVLYDANVLEFKNAVKGPKAGSLMHVVNSKTPGRVVVVMAGARGIKGENFPIVTLDFLAKPCAQESCISNLKITEAQLMSDKLKDLEFSLKSQDVVVVPSKEATASPAPPEKMPNAS
ncbi:cellulosome anchoring protein cohesin region [Desulfatibacillum aliphaticivorans]|uniref:Cellulosome anchoring protein cohesin region n=1 Tax=Desulfatibacillum aliphaticivorans TaxID=218208 RepID=B8FB20_DESAL|nr:cellulosome anchoring protein cohesin region [Desulfatibacillum aliphaticivorans]